jgi:hypothetical protein
MHVLDWGEILAFMYVLRWIKLCMWDGMSGVGFKTVLADVSLLSWLNFIILYKAQIDLKI